VQHSGHAVVVLLQRGQLAAEAAGLLGLTFAASAALGWPSGMTVPSPEARVGVTQPHGSTSDAPARTWSSRPHDRKISMLRVLIPSALDSPEISARFSTTSTRIP
jgi:hypothetical protein